MGPENDNYTEYAILEAKINELKERQSKIKAEILDEMVKNGVKNAKTDLGTFNIAILKSWTYSEDLGETEKSVKEEVKELNEQVKAMKAKEEEDGIATCEETPSLRFTAIKL